MSDLEDDVLMAFLSKSRENEVLKERGLLVHQVWVDLDKMLKVLLTRPYLAKAVEPELNELKKSVQKVLAFDAKHKDGPTA